MVQILVHVRPADRGEYKHFESFQCQASTSIVELKQQVAERGAASGQYSISITEQELVFMGERCENAKRLTDYGICEDFISQVVGFVVNPETPGRRFVDGVLVPCE